MRRPVISFPRPSCVHVTRYLAQLLKRPLRYLDAGIFVGTTRNANVIRVLIDSEIKCLRSSRILDRTRASQRGPRVLRRQDGVFATVLFQRGSSRQFRKNSTRLFRDRINIVVSDATRRPSPSARILTAEFGRRSGNSSSTSEPRLCLALKATQQTFIYFGFSRSGTRVLFQDTSRTRGRDVYVCQRICTRIRATRARIEAG